MKKLSFTLIILLLLISLSSCGAGEDIFELTYESDRQVYLTGETVRITAKVTNISGRTYRYRGGSSDYRPYVRLYPVIDGNHLGEPLEHLPIASTTDAPSWHKIADGKSGQVTFEFPLPDGAYVGKYTVELSYDGEIEVFPGALTVLKPSAQNEQDGLPYSRVTVSSGGEAVHPLKGLFFSNQYLNGEPALCADGKGVYWFFDDQELDHNAFPYLVLDSEIKASAPENVNIGNVKIYDLDYNEIEYLGGFEALSDLAVGEYLVVFTEYHDGSLKDPNAKEYWKTCYEDLFKLIVRS